MKQFILPALLTAALTNAQDPYIFNANQSLLQVNPSFAGSNGGIRNQFNYLNLSPNLSGNLTSYQNTTDAYLQPLNGALALSLGNEDQRRGVYRRNSAALTYAQSFHAGKFSVIPSLQASYWMTSVDINALNFRDVVQDDIVWNDPGSRPLARKGFAEMAGGILVKYGQRFYGGAAVFHANRPDYGHFPGYRRPVRVSVHAAYTLSFGDKWMVQPAYYYRQYGVIPFHQVHVNTLFANRMILGLSYATINVAGLNAGIRFRTSALQYTYSAAFMPESRYYGSAHTLQYSINIRKKPFNGPGTTFEAF